MNTELLNYIIAYIEDLVFRCSPPNFNIHKQDLYYKDIILVNYIIELLKDDKPQFQKKIVREIMNKACSVCWWANWNKYKYYDESYREKLGKVEDFQENFYNWVQKYDIPDSVIKSQEKETNSNQILKESDLK